jgi:hypothetical protein
VSGPIPALSSPSPITTGFAFRCSSPTRRTPIWRPWRRGHARVEDRIRCGKASGLRNLPFRDFAANEVWLELVLVAQDLVAWTQRLCLDGEAAQWEPKRLRYCLLHVAARLVRSGRRLYLRLQCRWPWTRLLGSAFERLRSLPAA